MLFHSIEFLFAFLPVTFFVYLIFVRQGLSRVAVGWIAAASLFFYGYWDPRYLSLILISMIVNYSLGLVLAGRRTYYTRVAFVSGIVFNLGLLGYFKYANFFVSNLNELLGTSYYIGQIILPIGISFFTFQQIAYLVDAYRHETKEYNFIDYSLFVLFFPQLIAGPIVHHKEMLPQFKSNLAQRVNWKNVAVGLGIFSIGIFKKVQLADRLFQFVTPVFNAAAAGREIPFHEAWIAALAYTLQIYFDFSGYSDMAIGLGKIFGISIPMNFNSPYKARNIIDFWRRWHITLSRFLRDYLYFPLGGNRNGKVRRYANLMITMMLGGFWHGASWNFLIWGSLHGVYLMANHACRVISGNVNPAKGKLASGAAWALTFLAVVVAWVFFRAETFGGAVAMLKSMAGINGLSIEPSGLINLPRAVRYLIIMLPVVFILPNTQQLFATYIPEIIKPVEGVRRGFSDYLQWRPHPVTAVALGLLMAAAVSYRFLGASSEFIYFQF